MSARCEAETCPYWTGFGCACEVMGIEPDVECDWCGGTGEVDGPFGYDTCDECLGTGRP